MAESGIDLGFDYSTLNLDDFDLEGAIDFEDLLGRPKSQEYYELQSKTMPVTERYLYNFVPNESHKATSQQMLVSRDCLLRNKLHSKSFVLCPITRAYGSVIIKITYFKLRIANVYFT